MSEGTHTAWVLSFIPLVAISILAAAAADAENTAERLGRVFGTIAIALLVGYVLRWIVMKLSRMTGPVWSPWVPVIATVVAILSLAGQAQS